MPKMFNFELVYVSYGHRVYLEGFANAAGINHTIVTIPLNVVSPRQIQEFKNLMMTQGCIKFRDANLSLEVSQELDNDGT